MRWSWLRALMLLATLLPLPAQSASPATCKKCLGAGVLPCARHAKLLPREQETAGCRRCSVANECKACSGALVIDCAMCNAGDATKERERRRQLARDWLVARRQQVDALTAREPFLHFASAWYDLAFGLKPATVGEEKVDAHTRMHVHGERLAALRALFVQTLELADADLPERMLVVMSEEAADHAILGPRLTGLGTANSVGLKLMGPRYVYSMWSDKRSMPDDDAVHRNLVHNVTHLLLSQMQPAGFLGNRQHGWLDEGVAHWFEDKVTGKCANFCFEEILLQAPASFRGGRWRPVVRKAVDERSAPPFATVSARNTDQLNYLEHAFAFAYVDFLLQAHGGAKFRDFLRLVKGDQATRDALARVYGLTPLSFDGAFHAWVVAHYSLQPPR
jgi:hypothetical protein